MYAQIPLAVLVAVFAAGTLYTLHALSAAGLLWGGYVFWAACCSTLCITLLHLWYRFLTVHRVPRYSKILLCGCVGIIAGAYSESTLRIRLFPPDTAAPLEHITAVTAVLTGEPVPTGYGSHRIPAQFVSCSTSDNALFSVVGKGSIVLPSYFIEETYSGGISAVRKNAEDTVKAARQLYAMVKDDTDTIEPCRFYARGAYLLIRGKFGKTGTVFFAADSPPVFLSWYTALSRFRAFLRFALMRMLFDWGDAGGLLLALLAADRAFLSEECRNAFRTAGLSHILALSGMHVSLISTAVMQSFQRTGRKTAAVFSLAAVCFFVWFAGAAPSLNRALGMMLIISAGSLLSVQPKPLPVLCTMFLVHILFFSEDAVSLGFMLSYGACAGIIIFGAAVDRVFSGLIPPLLLNSTAASVGAQTFTAPITVFFIGSLPLAGIIASCAVSPVVSFFLIAGLVSTAVCTCIPVCIPFFGRFLDAVYTVIVVTASFFSKFPLWRFSGVWEKYAAACFLFCIGAAAVLYAAVVNRKDAALIRQVNPAGISKKAT